MELITEYLLPPLLGAVIGYITNHIAIKMIFKPYTEWRILGIKIPFTPGIIPKHRVELAENISKVISTVLINKDTLHSQIISPHAHSVMDKLINTKIDYILNYDIPPIIKLIPDKLIGTFDQQYSELKKLINKKIIEYLNSPSFENTLYKFLLNNTQEIINTPIKDLIQTETAQDIIKKITEYLFQNLSADTNLSNWIKERLDDIAQSHRQLKEVLPDEFINVLLKWVKKELPDFLENLKTAVYESKLDQKLYESFRKVIYNYLENLNMVQRFVVNIWGVEDRVDEDLPKVIQQAILVVFENLKSEDSQEHIINSLKKSIHNAMEREIKELFQDSQENIKDNLMDKIQIYFNDTSNFSTWQDKFLTLYETYHNLTISEIIGNNTETSDSINNSIHKMLLAILRNQKFQQSIINFLETNLYHWIKEYPIGKPGKWITLNQSDKDKLSYTISEYFLNLLVKEISSVAEAINIQQLVFDRINIFPLEKLENIIMTIVNKHLSWINIFGAILGAIIGGIQIILKKL